MRCDAMGCHGTFCPPPPPRPPLFPLRRDGTELAMTHFGGDVVLLHAVLGANLFQATAGTEQARSALAVGIERVHHRVFARARGSAKGERKISREPVPGVGEGRKISGGRLGVYREEEHIKLRARLPLSRSVPLFCSALLCCRTMLCLISTRGCDGMRREQARESSGEQYSRQSIASHRIASHRIESHRIVDTTLTLPELTACSPRGTSASCTRAISKTHKTVRRPRRTEECASRLQGCYPSSHTLSREA